MSRFTLFLILCPFIAAATPGDRLEAVDNVADRADDRRDLANDRIDRARLVVLVDDWHDARAAGNGAAETRADDALRRWVRQEIAESAHEVREARVEVAQSTGEVIREQQEVARDRRRGRAAAAADDRRDRRDDSQDLRDDQRDLSREQADLTATVRIAEQLRDGQPAFERGNATPAQAAEKSRLLRQLQVLARAEVARDHGELREDRAETREDRRERSE
ncbi:MAG: hypothetical protein ACJATT_003528 [Myxococcota bacterium]|jgi:hypothetical protein